jgi:hypothetical protein
VHITAAADELLTHVLATGEDVLADESTLMTLARIGAQAVMTRAELDGPIGDALISPRPQVLSRPPIPHQG